jgi:hypothetical protein
VTELYWTSDGRLSAKLVPIFADRGRHVVSVTDPYGRILGFLDRSRYFFFQVAPQLYSRGWVDLVPNSLLLRKSGSAGNRTRTSGSVVRTLDHKTTEAANNNNNNVQTEIRCPLMAADCIPLVQACRTEMLVTWPVDTQTVDWRLSQNMSAAVSPSHWIYSSDAKFGDHKTLACAWWHE